MEVPFSVVALHGREAFYTQITTRHQLICAKNLVQTEPLLSELAQGQSDEVNCGGKVQI